MLTGLTGTINQNAHYYKLVSLLLIDAVFFRLSKGSNVTARQSRQLKYNQIEGKRVNAGQGLLTSKLFLGASFPTWNIGAIFRSLLLSGALDWALWISIEPWQPRSFHERYVAKTTPLNISLKLLSLRFPFTCWFFHFCFPICSLGFLHFSFFWRSAL